MTNYIYIIISLTESQIFKKTKKKLESAGTHVAQYQMKSFSSFKLFNIIVRVS